jgi:hypothetical protein
MTVRWLIGILVVAFIWIAWLDHAFFDAAALGRLHALGETVTPGTPRAAVETELVRRHLRWNYWIDGVVYATRGGVPAARYPHPAMTIVVPAGATIGCSHERLETISFDDADRVSYVGKPALQSMCW